MPRKNRVREVQLGLDGNPAPKPLAKSKVVQRGDGRFAVGVLQPRSASYVAHGSFLTAGEAHQARRNWMRDGLGAFQTNSETILLLVDRR